MLPKWGADGDYGDETVEAVKSFQTAKGITSSGSVDGLTLALLQDHVAAVGDST